MADIFVEKMVKKKKIPISYIGEMYIRELEEYRKDIL